MSGKLPSHLEIRYITLLSNQSKENRGLSAKSSVPCGVPIVILPVPCGVLVVLVVVELAVVTPAVDAGVCSEVAGVVGVVTTVGVDGVVLNEQQNKRA